MTTKDNSSLTSRDKPPLLEKVLEKNEEVKDRVVNCVDELSIVNEQ